VNNKRKHFSKFELDFFPIEMKEILRDIWFADEYEIVDEIKGYHFERKKERHKIAYRLIKNKNIGAIVNYSWTDYIGAEYNDIIFIKLKDERLNKIGNNIMDDIVDGVNFRCLNIILY